jgi:hypothetical protein
MSEQLTPLPIKRIPYGVADYRRMRADNSYYVDKTHFIPLLEAAPYYLFCVRPRRFGKSLWLSVLQHYYDLNLQDEFEQLFGGTFIGVNPSAERNSYLLMFVNFAGVNPDLRYVEDSFERNGQAVVDDFLIRYTRFFDAEKRKEILAQPRFADQLRQIFFHAQRARQKVYLLIDEYDNFANTILTTAGQTAYHSLTHGGGFFRYFFNFLKSATAGQTAGLARLFITGVSPVTMDDVSSGFNIGSNISQNAAFNEMIGFSELEVQALLAYYAAADALRLNLADTLALLRSWYGNYRFSEEATAQLFNSDMVLYFVKEAWGRTALPKNLIDQNIRIDYEKLRHLIAVDKQLNGNFSQLQSIIETGEVVSEVVTSFPLERLRQPENFVSLLCYFGLLSFAGEKTGRPLLRIPNLTVRDLMYGYIRAGLQDVDIFRIDLWRLANLLNDMAYRGEWQAVFDFLTSEIQQQSSIRDYLNGEKVIQGFLLAYLNVTHFFLIWPEHEMGGGFVDLYLEPFLARYPDMGYGYLLELKYLARGEDSDARLQEKITQAAGQLQRYAHDERVRKVAGHVTMKYLILVYRGWELVYSAEWQEPTE